MKSFLKNLHDFTLATKIQKKTELWDVKGILKNRLNQSFKFDLRPLENNTKSGSLKTKADKMVFDMKDKWIIVDIEELHTYIKEHKLKIIQLEELISKLDWNIILPKK
jgi:hypothetical protein